MTQQPSILIVDDESGILDTLRILLRKEGFEVTTAQGGKAGLDQIRSGSHDIVLTDVIEGVAKGKALDLAQTAAVEGYNATLSGCGPEGYAALQGADVCIVTARLPASAG